MKRLSPAWAILLAGLAVAINWALFPRYTEISHSGYHVEHDRWTGAERTCLDSYATAGISQEQRCKALP